MVDQHDTGTSETISRLVLWNGTEYKLFEIRKNLGFF